MSEADADQAGVQSETVREPAAAALTRGSGDPSQAEPATSSDRAATEAGANSKRTWSRIQEQRERLTSHWLRLLCTQSDGSYNCACSAWFNPDAVDCSGGGPGPIDECAAGSDNCSDNATCTDTAASFSCACNTGYTGNGISCAAVDACQSAGCDANASCTEQAGSAVCACNTGFTGDGQACADIDECTQGTDNCSADATCANTAGGFTCACNAGFNGDGVTCTAATGGCANNDCDERAVCQPTSTGFTCACTAGYSGDGRSCLDIDECALDTDNCASNATCANTAGGFTCACNAGLSGDGVTCTDINECGVNNGGCAPERACLNTPGGASCGECNVGYTANGPTGCDDVNECAANNGGCDALRECVNSPGSSSCGACAAGFVPSGATGCTDSDECLINNGGCDPLRVCTNSAGGVACGACPAGYAALGATGCADVDECATNNGGCASNATCANSAGNFTCTCNAGFEGNGVTCSAIDQCANNDCDANAQCQSAASGFTCTCRAGFAGDGRTCTDVNECAQNNGGCSPDATCSNSVGASACACNAGFTGNGTTCSDINECTQNTDNCGANATCTNTAGAFSCACNAGFAGDGVTCTAVVQSCDLTGTYAVLSEADVAWDPVLFSGVTVITGGADTVFAWSLRKLTQAGTTITAEVRSCGATVPDVCSPFLSKALTQQTPDSIWELASMPRMSSSFTLPDAPDPGDAFVGPIEASLLGLQLANPLGPWPATYTDPAIVWLDHDSDGQLGVTSTIPTTGTSAACQLPYGALPIPSSGELATSVYTGSRALANLSGTIVDCNTLQGTLAGPEAGSPQLNGHVVGCMKSTGTACTDAETASLDQSGSTAGQRVTASRFTMVRVPDSTTCAQARTLAFP